MNNLLQRIISVENDLYRLAIKVAELLKPVVRVKLTGGRLPTKATAGAAGWDLAALGDYYLLPRTIALINTGVSLEIPPGFEGQIRSRSGLAKTGIFVINSPGTIDSDYRGDIGVLLANFSSDTYKISAGDRIAQLVIVIVPQSALVTADLTDTARGSGGFGSTGA